MDSGRITTNTTKAKKKLHGVNSKKVGHKNTANYMQRLQGARGGS